MKKVFQRLRNVYFHALQPRNHKECDRRQCGLKIYMQASLVQGKEVLRWPDRSKNKFSEKISVCLQNTVRRENTNEWRVLAQPAPQQWGLAERQYEEKQSLSRWRLKRLTYTVHFRTYSASCRKHASCDKARFPFLAFFLPCWFAYLKLKNVCCMIWILFSFAFPRAR